MTSENVDPKSRVQVSVRLRPPNKSERNDKLVLENISDRAVQINEDVRADKLYTFDHVFSSTQADVFETLGRPMLEEAYKGFNVCLFAYGQTGSGKTYSLLGDIDNEERRGIAPRFVQALFDEAQRMVEEDPDLTIKVTLSMVEVYMEKVRDLLATRQRGQEPESLDIHEDSNRRVFVKGAGVHQVLGFDRMMQLLKKGNANRQTAETKMNETSSRSHAIMQIGISQEYQSIERKDLECTVSFVDLAGSERQTKTESTGQQFEEAKKINHSLLMLGRALNSFSERKGSDAFISLRESKLTRLLSESFGGNSKTWMLATVSPTAYNLTESISTLEYARNAMAITNKARVNKSLRDFEYQDLLKLRDALDAVQARERTQMQENDAKISSIREEIEALKEQLSAFNDTAIEDQLHSALVERDTLIDALRGALVQSRSGCDEVLVAFSGTCKMSLASIPLGSYDVATLVVPLYDLVGPPPLVQCSVHTSLLDNGDVVVVVEVQEVQHLPDFCTGGARVTMWFEGQPSSRVSTGICGPNGGNPYIMFRQTYCFGPLTEELQRYFSSDVLYFQVDGIIGDRCSPMGS